MSYVYASLAHESNSQSSSAALRTNYSIIKTIKSGFVLTDPIRLPGKVTGHLLSLDDKLIFMLFIDDVNSTLCSSHPHTRVSAARTHADIQTAPLTSWPGIWAQCRSAWQTRPRFPDAPLQSKPSTHRLPGQPGFWPRPLLQRRSRSERCSVEKNVDRNIQHQHRSKQMWRRFLLAFLVCTCHLMKTRVLHVVRRSLLLSFYLHANLKANGARHCGLVSSLFCETGNTHIYVRLWCRTKHLL